MGFRRIKVEKLPGAESSMQSASSMCQASHLGLWHVRARVAGSFASAMQSIPGRLMTSR